MKFRLPAALALTIASLIAGSASATETSFAFKTAYRNVKADPDGVWTGAAVASGNVSIFEYQLCVTGGEFLISQIWNDDCSSNLCPTRLVRIEPDGGRTVLVDDMMRQVVPPNDPRFADLPKSGPQAEYAAHPFRLSEDGKTLLNGDYKFELGGRGR